MPNYGINYDFNGLAGGSDPSPGPDPGDIYVHKDQGVDNKNKVLGIGNDGFVVPVDSGSGQLFTWTYHLNDYVNQQPNFHWYRIAQLQPGAALGIRMFVYPAMDNQSPDKVEVSEYHIFNQLSSTGKWNWSNFNESDICPLGAFLDNGVLNICYQALGGQNFRLIYASCDLINSANTIWDAYPLDSGASQLPNSGKRMLPTAVQSDQGTGSAGKILKVNSTGWVITDDIPTPDISGKVDKNQGTANNGKVLGIGTDGYVMPVPAGGGSTGIFPWEAVMSFDVPATTAMQGLVLQLETDTNLILRWISTYPNGGSTHRNGITDYYITYDGVEATYRVVSATALHSYNDSPFWYYRTIVNTSGVLQIFWDTAAMGYHAFHELYCQVLHGSYTAPNAGGGPPSGSVRMTVNNEKELWSGSHNSTTDYISLVPAQLVGAKALRLQIGFWVGGNPGQLENITIPLDELPTGNTCYGVVTPDGVVPTSWTSWGCRFCSVYTVKETGGEIKFRIGNSGYLPVGGGCENVAYPITRIIAIYP